MPQPQPRPTPIYPLKPCALSASDSMPRPTMPAGLCDWRIMGRFGGDSFRAFIHIPRGNRVIRAIMRELSEAYFKEKEIRFPPADYRVPAGYKLYV